MKLKELMQGYFRYYQPSLLPIYMGLAGITIWLAAVTVLLLAEVGADAAAIRRLELPVTALALFFGFWPFVRPLVGIVAERWPSGEEAL